MTVVGRIVAAAVCPAGPGVVWVPGSARQPVPEKPADERPAEVIRRTGFQPVTAVAAQPADARPAELAALEKKVQAAVAKTLPAVVAVRGPQTAEKKGPPSPMD